MPNWCENRLKIQGPPEELNKLVEEVKADAGDKNNITSLSLAKIVPEPPAEEIEKYRQESENEAFRMPGWWYWRVDHWGTKWELQVQKPKRVDDNKLEYSFDSAWAPPVPAIKKLMERYPALRIRLEYWELGMCFAGYVENNADGEIEEVQGEPQDFSFSKDAYWALHEENGE